MDKLSYSLSSENPHRLCKEGSLLRVTANWILIILAFVGITYSLGAFYRFIFSSPTFEGINEIGRFVLDVLLGTLVFGFLVCCVCTSWLVFNHFLRPIYQECRNAFKVSIPIESHDPEAIN